MQIAYSSALKNSIFLKIFNHRHKIQQLDQPRKYTVAAAAPGVSKIRQS